MTEIEQWLERQARWQKSRAALSWAEKLRMAETLRNAALALRGGRRGGEGGQGDREVSPGAEGAAGEGGAGGEAVREVSALS